MRRFITWTVVRNIIEVPAVLPFYAAMFSVIGGIFLGKKAEGLQVKSVFKNLNTDRLFETGLTLMLSMLLFLVISMVIKTSMPDCLKISKDEFANKESANVRNVKNKPYAFAKAVIEWDEANKLRGLIRLALGSLLGTWAISAVGSVGIFLSAFF